MAPSNRKLLAGLALCCGLASACDNTSSAGLVASTYFAGYHANKGFPVSAMPWDKYTEAKYAFAETTADGCLNLSSSEPDQLPVFVAAAKAHNVKALISIGGWTGSRYFSSNVATAANRTRFVTKVLDFVKQYNLDGVDFDWEYPNRQGIGCNTINVNDTANFLAFLQELRAQPAGAKLTLTAAASLYPWYNSSGVSSTDLSGFSKVLDYVMIMNYDVYGAWTSTGGPNAPIEMACDPQNNQGGGKEGVAKWLGAGVPANKIVLGVPAYGHGFSVNTTSAFSGPNGSLAAFPPQNSSHRFQGSSWDDDAPIDECGNTNPPGGTYTFWSLITEANMLNQAGDPQQGIASGYDTCSQTPFIYNQTAQVWVSYDDKRSFAAKANWILSAGLGGFAMFEAGGDYKNILVDSIRAALHMA